MSSIKQFRYYSSGNDKNYPEQYSSNKFYDPPDQNAFANYTTIKHLGIQALPGTKFYINNSLEPIIVGYTGIFELELEEAQISGLRFEKKSIELIDANSNGYLIVDIVYDEGEGGNSL